MNNTIFDLVETDLPEGQKGFLELAKNAPQPKEKSFLNDISEYGKTFLKGSVEGLSKLGQIMGPLQESPRIENGKLKLGRTHEEQLLEQSENLDKFLPTEDESFGQRALRRGLKEAPTALSFPGSSLGIGTRALGAGVFGETAESLGAPEWLQTAAELTAYLGPDVTKKLLSSGKNKEIIDAGRKLGLTDEQITPLIQSETKQKWLSKFINKRGRTQKSLEDTKSAIAKSYSKIQTSPKATKPISGVSAVALEETIEDKLFNMPSKVRARIRKDVRDLFNKPVTGESLINLYSDINHNLSGKTKQLTLLKEPIKQALKEVSPDLVEDFELVNKLYTKYYPIASKLKPTITSDIIAGAEAIGVLGSLVTGNFFTLGGIITEQAAKKLSQQMLLNPHMQQLSKKMVVALNQNKYQLAKKVSEDFIKEIRKTDKESARKLEELSDEELEKFFLSNQ